MAQSSVLPPFTVPLQQWSSRDARARVTSGKDEQVVMVLAQRRVHV